MLTLGLVGLPHLGKNMATMTTIYEQSGLVTHMVRGYSIHGTSVLVRVQL